MKYVCGFVLLQEDQVFYTMWNRSQIHNWKVIAS
jgi:hypothetical protein